MPTYEYACGACGHQWEQVQRITEPAVKECPVCAKPEAHRLISGGTNFILKGGGWYSDLYASPKAATKDKEKADSAAPAPAVSGENQAAKTEAKPEAKAPAASEPAAPTRSSPPATSG
jgi:putative FmdB family regulatory protein